MGGMLLVIFVLSNLAIASGYIYAASAVVPQMKARRWQTKVGGILFFLTCGLTHLELALHAAAETAGGLSDFESWHMIAIHLVQACAVWLFLTSLYRELVEGTIGDPFQLVVKEGDGDD